MPGRRLALRAAAALARRRLRRLGGTDTVAWAVRVPVVTLPAAALLCLACSRLRVGARRR